MKRIAVIGCPGSGKSTLARRLGATLGLPVTHLDTLYWQPGWRPHPDPPAFEARVRAIVEQDSWIIDGGFLQEAEAGRLRRADTLVLFDLPMWLCLWRVHKRLALDWNRTRTDTAHGCPERFDPDFVRYIVTYRRRILPFVDNLLVQQFTGRTVRIQAAADLAEFLESISKSGAQHGFMPR